MIRRTIPRSTVSLPVIGLGTWKGFDKDPKHYMALGSVLDVLAKEKGALIDTSPMYGRAEEVIGDITADRPDKDRFFYATKVWTTGKAAGIRQMEESMKKMGRTTMDLMQIHNLVDWETHLETLKEWKAAGKVRYIGITHYTDDSHPVLEKLIGTGDFDFVQFTYSILNRNAERRLLPAAAANGVATLINRPFGEGSQLRRLTGKAIPAEMAAAGITTWPALFLKYIISHPAVTCVIPGTADADHMEENRAAGDAVLPGDSAAWAKMVVPPVRD
ncbi:MAG: aldo/keto reductase [Sphingobacteriales bacterium]|nr:MAG: aldo/keto reductase [Sphingobacteriales bacterium]